MVFASLRHLQSHDVGVGVVHGDADGVFLALVFGVVVGASLQEEANEAAAEKRKVAKSPAAQMKLLLPGCVLDVVYGVFPSSLNYGKL